MSTLKPFSGDLDEPTSPETSSGLQPFTGTLDGEKPKRSLVSAINDNVIEVANAAAGNASAVANFVRPGNAASQWIDKNFIEAGQNKQSDVVKSEKARYAQEMQQAQGFGDEVSATLGYVARNPLLAAAQAAGSFAGTGLAVGGARAAVGALGMGAKAATRTGLAAGAGFGMAAAGGDAAGTAYELSREGGATDEQAVAAARGASVIPGAWGAVGGLVGAERLVAGAKGFGGGLAARALKTGAVEGAQEALEEGVTQYEGQRAAVPFNPELDPMKGVAGAATMGAVLGGMTGGGTSLLTRQNQPARKPSEDLGLNPDNGPISKVAAAAVDEGRAAAPMQPEQATQPEDGLSLAPEEQAQPQGPTMAQRLDALPQQARAQADQLLREIADERIPDGVKRFRAHELQQILDAYPVDSETGINIPTAERAAMGPIVRGYDPATGEAPGRPLELEGEQFQDEGGLDFADEPSQSVYQDAINRIALESYQTPGQPLAMELAVRLRDAAQEQGIAATIVPHPSGKGFDVQATAALAALPDDERQRMARVAQEPTAAALPYDDSSTGRMVADAQGNARPELRPEAVERDVRWNQERAQAEAEFRRRAELGLSNRTPVMPLQDDAAPQPPSQGQLAPQSGRQLAAKQPPQDVQFQASTGRDVTMRNAPGVENAPIDVEATEVSPNPALGMTRRLSYGSDGQSLEQGQGAAAQPGPGRAGAQERTPPALPGPSNLRERIEAFRQKQAEAARMAQQVQASPVSPAAANLRERLERFRQKRAEAQVSPQDFIPAPDGGKQVKAGATSDGGAQKKMTREDVEAETTRQMNEQWAAQTSNGFTIGKHYPATLNVNGKERRVGLFKKKGSGTLYAEALDQTIYGPSFTRYKVTKEGKLEEVGSRNLYGLDKTAANQQVAEFNAMFESADTDAAKRQKRAAVQQPMPAEGMASNEMTARQAQEAGAKARQEAKKTQRKAEREQAAPAETGLRVGVAPGSADPVTVRDGVVHIGDYEAMNYDTGEPVTVPKGSTRADVAVALKDAGVLSSRQKMFGLSEKAQEVMFSRSAMKSTEANIARGRESLAKALNEKTTVHRAMFRNGLGWVDFVWGSEGRVKPSGKTQGAMGIAHILEARQRKDGLSEKEAIQSLSKVVESIALGQEVARLSYDNSVAVRVENAGYRVSLTQNPGSNAWVVTAFEVSQAHGRSGFDTRPSTQPISTLSREGLGADSMATGDTSPSLKGATHRDSTKRGSPTGADSPNSLAPIYAGSNTDDKGKWSGDGTTMNTASADANPDILYSKSARAVTNQTVIKLRRAMVQRTVDALAKDWAKAPNVTVVDGMQDERVPDAVREADAAQRSQGATGEPEGFWYRGQVYLVASALPTSADAARVLYHEVLGHHGLRGHFGKDLDRVLDQVIKLRRRDVQAKAQEYGLDMGNPEHASYAAEEVLAELAQSRPDLGFVQRAIAAIRNFLRAHVPGFKTMELTDADIVQGYLLPARGWVERGAGTGSAADGSMLSRSGSIDQAETDAFKRWFGDSKVVDAQGKPLVVYHGTEEDFSEFSREYIGSANTQTPIGSGFFFAKDPAVASRYAERASANVMPVYVSVQNPAPTLEAMTATGSEYDGFINSKIVVARSPAQIKSATGNNGQFDPANPDIRFSRSAAPSLSEVAETGRDTAWTGPAASQWDDFIYKMQDKHIDTKRALEAVRATGKAVSDELDVYLQEELYHGRAAKRTEDFVKQELEPLLQYMSIAGLKMADVEEYLHARHAKEANAVIAQRNPGLPDGGSGMTNAEADAVLGAYAPMRLKLLEKAAVKVDAIIAGTRNTFVEYGLESQDVVDGWAQSFAHYVPLMREQEGDGMAGLGTGQGFSVKGKEVKGRTGSTKKVVDILANIAMQRERAIVRGEKNRVAAALVGLAKAYPSDFWKVDVVPTRQVLGKDGMVKTEHDPLYKQRDNVVVAKIPELDAKTGKVLVKEHAVLFNENDARALRMAQALKNLDAAQLEGMLGATAKVTRYLAAINTQYNPIFGITNLARDLQGAAINLQSTALAGRQGEVLAQALPALRGIYLEMRSQRKGSTTGSQWSKLWDEFQEFGGQTGYRDQFRTSADRGQAIERALDPSSWAETNWGRFFTAGGRLKVPLEMVRKTMAPVLNWLDDYNTAMENGVRLAAYKAGLDAGLSKERAASIAKNLTTNFNRKGQVAQQVGALYAFFNASMQGTARIGEALFTMEPGQPKTLRLSALGRKVVAGGVMLGAAQALMLAAAGFGDDEPPEHVRERNLVIPLGGKRYATIPLPLGLHVLPNLGRIPAEFALGGFENPAEQVLKVAGLFADAFNPIGNSGLSMQTLVPTVLDPLAALAENRDFAGRAIAKESFNPITPGHALARDTATAHAKLIAEAVNFLSGGTAHVRGALSPTPDQIDYLIGQFTGGVGRELSKLQQSVVGAAQGDAVPAHKVPVLGRFYGDANSPSAKQAAFYNHLDSIARHAEQVKGLRLEGEAQAANAYLQEHPEARLALAAKATSRAIQKMREQRRELEQQGAAREQVRQIEEQMTARMEQFNAQVERAMQ